MSVPLLSIIIVNYNTFALTCKCIESIYQHTTHISFEIILVDNASSEVNPDKFLDSFPDIKLLKSSTNLGFAKGNNLGILHAQGQLILLVNSDTELKNNACKVLADYLQVHDDVGVVTCKLVYPDGRVQNNCQRFPHWKISLLELLRVQKIFKRWGQKKLLGPFFRYDELVVPDWVWGTFFMFRKKDLAAFPNKLLPDDFFMYGEDMQWCMEFKKQGLKIVYLPDGLVLHHLGGSSANSKKMMAENNKVLFRRYYHPFHLKAIKFLNSLI